MQKLDGGYDYVDYYASANMWQLQNQKVHLGHIWTYRDLGSWSFDPKIWYVYSCPKSVKSKSLVKFRQSIPKITC